MHPSPRQHGIITDVPTPVHRFEHTIAGRLYVIEVALVARDRWRAYIAKIPGVPTALMPFYGRTPDDAANQLCQWLTRAHQRANGGSPGADAPESAAGRERGPLFFAR
jgi:hypothetical protein